MGRTENRRIEVLEKALELFKANKGRMIYQANIERESLDLVLRFPRGRRISDARQEAFDAVARVVADNGV